MRSHSGAHPDSASAELFDELRAIGLRHGLDALGVASADPFVSTRQDLESRAEAGLQATMHFTYGNPERATTPTMALSGARSLVVAARSYRDVDPPLPVGPAGQVARYVRRDDYGELRTALSAIAHHLKAGGWRARVLCDDNGLVDREAAYRAGLGWYGKNANLLMEGKGSWFVLGSVVTDADLPPAKARVGDGCASCTRCLDSCPTGAIVAPGVVDARRCLAWLLQAEGVFPVQWREALGGRIYGCDDCQEVCPVNRRSERADTAHPDTAHPDTAHPDTAHEEGAFVDLVAMLEASDDELVRRHGRWYIPKRQARFLRRNALVALGNVGDGSDPRVSRALSTALGHGDALVRGHAVWAAARLGRRDLVDRLLVDEHDPLVIEELALVSLQVGDGRKGDPQVGDGRTGHRR
ncbi:MAG: tRNA epoxyqueuosine(34) reductase QueG [Actinobacteria bacterium]|nr:tRNA epoxyqueuosine(34) reductase QueG [Actinomycetota bacterium]